MILCVGLNLALDVTYTVDRLVLNQSHRVESVHTRAGGKAVNVARVLRMLGYPATVAGLVGGQTGDAVTGDLTATGLPHELVPVRGETRCTVAVVSTADGEATVLNEPGPAVAEGEWEAFRGRFAELAAAAEAVVLSGSLPPGVPADAYARLIDAASASGAWSVVDTSGDALRRAAAHGPRVLAPNAAEATAATGGDDPLAAGEILRRDGTDTVVVSLGADGLLAVTGHGAWRAAPPRRERGNPTGAGDAATAALSAGLLCGQDWPTILRDAVAVSAAAVRAPVAGAFDRAAYQPLRRGVAVHRVTGRSSCP